jgi:hypothetical protein
MTYPAVSFYGPDLKLFKVLNKRGFVCEIAIVCNDAKKVSIIFLQIDENIWKKRFETDWKGSIHVFYLKGCIGFSLV